MRQAAYLGLKAKELETRAREAVAELAKCRLCPRECKVDRTAGPNGLCHTGARARVSSFNAHFGEEKPLTGWGGSGTIFFSRCNLSCVFCQNFDVSHQSAGIVMRPDQLASVMIMLQGQGCHNVNLVSPSHVVPQILEALVIAVEKGLRVPLVYNTGGYDKVETLKRLDGIVDIYMPDFKFWDGRYSTKWCRAPDYPKIVRAAITEMHRQVGDIELDDSGLAVRGLLVRHLVMPGGAGGTAEVMKFLAGLSPETYVNVMDQYRPCGRASLDENLNRRVSPEEFEAAMEATRAAGIHRIDREVGLSLRAALFPRPPREG